MKYNASIYFSSDETSTRELANLIDAALNSRGIVADDIYVDNVEDDDIGPDDPTDHETDAERNT